MLFVLVINALNFLLQRATDTGVLHRLTSRHGSSISLFFDDVVIFCHPESSELAAIRALLHTFGVASGMHINYEKCSITPIHRTDDMAVTMGTTLSCPVAPFPIK